MKITIIIFFLLVSGVTFSQNLNSYKYAQVPSKFDFVKEKDEYRLNTLTKMYMEKYGFETYYDTDEIPDSIANNKCNKVYVYVQQKSNMFSTKIIILLKDCKKNILFTSKEGFSKEKEYAIAYNEAFREAFQSLSVLNHKYEPVSEAVVIKDISTKIPIDYSDFSYVVKIIKDGYLITDKANPSFFLKLLRTSNPQIFIGQSNTDNGLVTVKKEDIIFEYYKNNLLISQMLMVKL